MKIDVRISEQDLDFNNGDQYDIDKLTLFIVRHFREMFPNSEIDITVDNCSHSSVKINGKYDGNDLLAEFWDKYAGSPDLFSERIDIYLTQDTINKFNGHYLNGEWQGDIIHFINSLKAFCAEEHDSAEIHIKPAHQSFSTDKCFLNDQEYPELLQQFLKNSLTNCR